MIRVLWNYESSTSLCILNIYIVMLAIFNREVTKRSRCWIYIVYAFTKYPLVNPRRLLPIYQIPRWLSWQDDHSPLVGTYDLNERLYEIDCVYLLLSHMHFLTSALRCQVMKHLSDNKFSQIVNRSVFVMVRKFSLDVVLKKNNGRAHAMLIPRRKKY